MNAPQPEIELGTEVVPAGEDEAISRITEIERELLQKRIEREQLPSAGRSVPRGQHAKQHGCVRAEFVVADDSPDSLRHGVFRQPGQRFPAWVRFSNARAADDRQLDARGMALQLLDVPGEKLLGGEAGEQTQDIVLLDSPVFFIRSALEFAAFDAALLHLQSAESWLSLNRLSLATYFLTHPYELFVLTRLAKRPPASPLDAQYWSTTPYKLGPFAVKYLAKPVPAEVPPPAPESSPDQLCEALRRRLLSPEGAAFDFFVQPQVHPVKTPIEDPTVEWDEQLAPCYKVGQIRIPPQSFDSPEQMAFGENLSFNPWHALPEHRPLGGINRVRGAVYRALSEFRHSFNRPLP